MSEDFQPHRTHLLLRFVSGVSRAALRSESQGGLLDAVCRQAVETGICASALLLKYAEADGQGGVFEPVSQAGIDLSAFPSLAELAAAVPASARFVAIADTSASPQLAELEKLGIGSLLLLALAVEGKPFGVIVLAYTDIRATPDWELAVLQQLAEDLGVAMDALRARRRQEAREQMATHLLEHDAATGLPTRTLLKKYIDQHIEEMLVLRAPLAVMVVHIDNLREVVNTFSFTHGDALLNEVGARLRSAAGGDAYLARYSEDAFALVLLSAGAEDARHTTRELVRTMARPCWVAGIEIEPRVRTGIAVFPGHGADAEMLLRRAGLAAEDARESAEGFAFHTGEPELVNARRVELATSLRSGIDAGNLALFCQPKISLADNRVCGMELLCRWRHPKYGMVPPGEFIPLAERTGLIKPLTDWVLKTAAADWHRICGAQGAMRFAVNVATRNLLDPWLVERIEDLLATWGISPGQLQIEITESDLMHDFDAALAVLKRLRAIGIELQIDDFGTGHSALAYLQRLPVSTLKIDQSFVRPILTDPVSHDIVRTVIQLAHNIGMKTVAEGIESPEVQHRLAELGCDMGQGFHIARPMPAGEFLPWLAQREPVAAGPQATAETEPAGAVCGE